MVFSSITFLFYFLPVVLLLYFVLPWRNAVLLLASLAFYAWGDLAHLPILLVYIVVNWAAGLAMADPRRRGAVAVLGIGANLGLLLVFKYAGFVGAQVNVAGGLLGLPAVPVPEIGLPLGISFFTFQGISYLIDIWRGDVVPQRSLVAFGMYKAMFPQLIAGPIVRYRMIAGRIAGRRVSMLRFRVGLQVFILGLAQKVLVADTVALPADRIFALPAGELTLATAWLGAGCYTVQILFDFAGYSNMAIGLAHMLGFRFPANFNRPYIAQSVTEFWRRWHMSLSGWFRDYLYIPLGGNRGSAAATFRNLLLVFVLCGFWHGASWTFLAWGLWHGALLIAERAGLGDVVARLWRPLRHGYLMLMVVLGWVLFRAETLAQAGHFYAAMVGLGEGGGVEAPVAAFLDIRVAAALVAGAVLSACAMPKGRGWVVRPGGGVAWQAGRDAAVYAGFLALFLLALAVVSGTTYSPFIYYRF
jgi:alginate O-acetyltransferase complex protein AlgI